MCPVGKSGKYFANPAMARRDASPVATPSKKAGATERDVELRPGLGHKAGDAQGSEGTHKVEIHKLDSGGYHTLAHHAGGSEKKTHSSHAEMRSHVHEKFGEEEIPGGVDEGAGESEPAHKMEVHKLEDGRYHTLASHPSGSHAKTHEDLNTAMDHAASSFQDDGGEAVDEHGETDSDEAVEESAGSIMGNLGRGRG